MWGRFKIEPIDESLRDYPPERLYLGWAVPAAFAFHFLLASCAVVAVYIHHIRSLEEMMTATVTQPPIDQMEIVLVDENKPPPPTDNPLWIRQLIIPKVIPKPTPTPTPTPTPKPTPRPVPIRIVPRLIVGAHNLPVPGYPPEAYRQHIEGTVMIQVSFDGSGSVSSAEVVDSSGSDILDSATRHFILSHWHEVDMAGQTQTVPIRYVFAH